MMVARFWNFLKKWYFFITDCDHFHVHCTNASFYLGSFCCLYSESSGILGTLKDSVFLVSFTLLEHLTLEIMTRALQWINIYRSQNDYMKSHNRFSIIFSFNKISGMLIGFSAAPVAMLIMCPDYAHETIKKSIIADFLIFAVVHNLFKIINVSESRINTVENVFLSNHGLNPGTAMAYSYFHGYLKIILPSTGDKNRKGIVALMEDYEANENGKIEFPVKKLFILIPWKAYSYPDLGQASDGWFEPAKQLETIKLDRAGVKGRSYMNSVYKIKPKTSNTKPIYVAAEGCTPLLTFWEVQNSAPSYKEFNNEIIDKFYSTLQNLLIENEDCRNCCELILYEEDQNPAEEVLNCIQMYTGN